MNTKKFANEQPEEKKETVNSNTDLNQRYVTKNMIGRGSYSEVYKCQDILNTDKKLIIKKILKPTVRTS